ncbi:hypothetical protein SK128_026138 [Halocaridina rubra]|uniref:tRNA (guanine-N(7)-)-methyltransferase non-catalytic subunit n=1 Tax=Halocaridina rubra TaxID=373956 RepID=A0AAN8XHW0_HALRR
MRYIEEMENTVIFCCGKAVIVYEKGSDEAKILTLPCSDNVPASEFKGVCIRLSDDKKYLAVACESKVVLIWSTDTWMLQHTHNLVKRPMSIDITSDSAVLLVADKTGDVYHFPLRGNNSSEGNANSENGNNTETDIFREMKSEPQPLLGHLSMLLDLVVTKDKKYIITSDRDEKIRVSHYPNSYNIESFCLGHREFVTQVDLLPGKEPLLLSCSGDGTLMLWNYLTGHCLSTVTTHEHAVSLLHHFEEYCHQRITDSEEAKRFLPEYPAVKNFSVCAAKDGCYHVAVVIDRLPALFLYKIENKKIIHTSTTKMVMQPLVVMWLVTGELMVEQNSEDEPLAVFQLQQETMTAVPNHPIILFGRKYQMYFNEGKKELNIDILYKQRYDNMADYLKKKQERLEVEKAVEAGMSPPLKKGRWV